MASKAKTIQRGRECFRKNARDRWLMRLKMSKYSAFIYLRFALAFQIPNSLLRIVIRSYEIQYPIMTCRGPYLTNMAQGVICLVLGGLKRDMEHDFGT